MSQNDEKRRKERYNAKLFIDLKGSMGESLGRAVAVDFSVTGFALDTEVDLKIGEKIDCHVEIPFNLKARVVRSIVPGQVKRYGLKIVNQTFFEKLMLKKLLKGKLMTGKI